MAELGTGIQEAGNALRASRNERCIVAQKDGIARKVATEVEYMGHSTKNWEPMGGCQANGIDSGRGIPLGGTAPRQDVTVAACSARGTRLSPFRVEVDVAH